MRSAGLALVAISGCSKIFGLEAPARQSDAAVDTITDDAPPDAQRSCMDQWLAGTPELTAPELFTEINTAGADATPAGTNFVVTWTTDRVGTGSVGGLDIWYVFRSAFGSPWSAPAIVGNVNSVAADWRLTTTAGTLTGFFESDRLGGEGASDVWTATRLNPTADFQTPTQTGLAAVNDGADQKDPAISADGLELFISSIGTISAATRPSANAPFDPPVVLSELTMSAERDPTPASDARLLLLTSNRRDGGGDIFYALRAARGQPFQTPVEVPTVNSAANDSDPWLTPDGCTLYFASTRPGSAGSDIYVSRMMPD